MDSESPVLIKHHYIIIEELSPWVAFIRDVSMYSLILGCLWVSRVLFGGSLALDVFIIFSVGSTFWVLFIPESQRRRKFSKDELRTWVELRKGPFA